MSALYQLYAANLLTIAKTMVVKHLPAAKAVNQLLISNGYYVDESRPETWKYYLNLAGEYHQYDNDVLVQMQENGSAYITIKVAGSVSPMDAQFTKTLLQDPTLAGEYIYGSPFYNKLIEDYPDFYDLIHGILNPIDINVAINAPDNAFLFVGGWNRVESAYGGFQFVQNPASTFTRNNLIEENETQIIFKLQEWFDIVFARWYNSDYSTFDEFYFPIVLSIIYTMIPGMIHNFRLENCQTHAAHSYHVNEFLESNGMLFLSASKLARNEKLWLYRNVKRLQNHKGFKDTFNDVVDNLLTPSGIPLAGYNLKHNTVNVIQELFSAASLTKETVNFNQIGTGSERVSIDSVMRKQFNVARSNLAELPYYRDLVQVEMNRSEINALPTRILDSQMLDTSDLLPYPLTRFLVNFWGYAASIGTYNGTIYVTNPVNGERLRLTPLNAFILMIYCQIKAVGLEIQDIPSVDLNQIPKPISPIYALVNIPLKPTANQLKQGAVAGSLEDEFFDGLVASSGDLFNFSNPSAFGQGAVTLHRELVNRYRSCCKLTGHRARAQGEDALNRLYYKTITVDLSPTPTSFESWLLLRGIDLSSLDPTAFSQLAVDITRQATNNLIDRSQELADLQAASLDILSRLMTYNTHLLSSINRGSILKTNPTLLRLESIILSSTSLIEVRLLPDARNEIQRSAVTSDINLHRSSRHVNVGASNPSSLFSIRRQTKRYRLNTNASHLITNSYPSAQTV